MRTAGNARLVARAPGAGVSNCRGRWQMAQGKKSFFIPFGVHQVHDGY
ncbi:hypothetical protein HW132_05530 [Brasilonema sp. CT11]|nr:hypothetical protein [Brasilonema sp. CT11]